MRNRGIKPSLVTLVLCFLPVAAIAAGSSDADGAAQPVHRMMLLVIQLGVIIFAAKLGNILFEKIRLPGALGELAVGIVIGPYALGHFGFWAFDQGLFPFSTQTGGAVSPELYGLSAIAAVVLLFNIGLETDLKLLIRYAVVGGFVGVGGLAASFLLGAWAAKVFGPMIFGHSLGLFDPPCLMLGVIATATSVGITARILSDRRLTDSPEGVTILSAAVIDDVLGIILLAIVMGLLSASSCGSDGFSWAHIAVVASKAIGVWLGATLVGLWATRKISFLLKWFGERRSISVMALGLALVLAGLFEEAGLAMIIGAYVMGLSLSKSDITYVIREGLAPITSLLIPVFFCVTGMQIDLSSLSSMPVVIFGLVYGIVALGAKVIGCGLPALLASFNLRGAARIGFGMAPRCEVALIIMTVGVSVGALGPELMAAVVIMVVVNTVLAPSAMSLLFRSDKRGTRHALEKARNEQSFSFDFPSLDMTNFFVGKLITVFESEGFFVHLINRSRNLHQLRMDSTVIEFRYSGTTLTFSCQPESVSLVHGVVLEALASLEKAIKGLKEPLDSTSMRAGMQEDTGPLGTNMLKVRDYLTVGLIEPELKGTTKAEIIDELLDVLVANRLITDRSAARQAVMEREESMSTGLQYGVAIPHGKTDTVTGLVCALGVKKDGVDFEAMDGEPSKIFILTLSPKSKPAPHVQFMSAVSKMLDETGRQRILSARSARAIYRFVTATP